MSVYTRYHTPNFRIMLVVKLKISLTFGFVNISQGKEKMKLMGKEDKNIWNFKFRFEKKRKVEKFG